jgi:periplasmic divalent cation tolerance protein
MTGQPTDVVAVIMTAPDAETAEKIGRTLVSERLAACANVVPGIVSTYWWDGEVQRAEEVMVILKTVQQRAQALEARAVELHPYTVPEVLVVPVSGGHAPYLAWVGKEVGVS